MRLLCAALPVAVLFGGFVDPWHAASSVACVLNPPREQ
jgi:hypothetical protein